MRYFFVAGLLALHFLAGHGAWAQQPDTTLHPLSPQPVRVPAPVFLLNGQLIVGDNGLANLDPQAIQRVDVYKGGADTPGRWRSLAAHGIILLTLKPAFRLGTIASRSLPQIRRELKLPATARFELDDLPLEDHTLRVATAAIARLDVRQAAGSEPVINIRLVRLPPRPVPPGTIQIRGLVRY